MGFAAMDSRGIRRGVRELAVALEGRGVRFIAARNPTRYASGRDWQ